MATTLHVNVFVYPNVINIGVLNTSQIENEAENIARSLGSANPFRTFNVDPILFELYNIQYSEKQVTRIDDNFYYYSLGTRFRLRLPTQSMPRRIRYLIRKSFSGDVSGDIGEALLAYFLVEEMGINLDSLGHTRPEKRKGLTPDFIVWDNSFSLSAIFQTSNYPLPILVEVKGFTGALDSVRIGHALGQLKACGSFPSHFGLAFLAIRNESRQCYDAYIVRVRT